jgi:signal transduction histidine kinase
LPQSPPGRPTPTGEESNGLGLAIVKHPVESRGGTTGAEFPEKTGGSLFWFELPVAT